MATLRLWAAWVAVVSTLLLVRSTIATAPCSSGPGSFGITSPKDGDTVLSGQIFNITWDTTGANCADYCIIGNRGIVQLELRTYFRGHPGVDYCTNFSSVIEWVSTNASNIGSYQWHVPNNLTSDHDYILSGNLVDPSDQYINGLQSGLFTVERTLDQQIPGSNTTTSTASTTTMIAVATTAESSTQSSSSMASSAANESLLSRLSTAFMSWAPLVLAILLASSTV